MSPISGMPPGGEARNSGSLCNVFQVDVFNPCLIGCRGLDVIARY